MCKCIEKVSKELDVLGTNTVLDVTWTIDAGGMSPSMCRLAVLKKNKAVRGKPATVIATYCPFCGKKYPIVGGTKPARKKKRAG